MKSGSLFRALALGLVPVTTFIAAAVFLPAIVAPRPIPTVELRLRGAELAEPAARTLARYCQSDPALFPRRLDYAWLPDALSRVRHGVTDLTTNGARVEFGGGLHHFGYELLRDRNLSSTASNQWRLEFYSAGSEPETLLTFATAVADTIDAGTLLTNITSAYAHQLDAFPADERAHRGRIRAFLRFGRVARARQACREMLVNLPDEWWPTLVNALLDVEERGLPAAEKSMETWVGRRPDFVRHLDLAYFHQLTDQPARAAAAVRQAIACDANLAAGTGGDTEFRGYHAAMHLYQAGQYEAVIALCDKLQSVWINGDYAKPSLRALRAAADQAMNGRVSAVAWPRGIPPFNPFDDLDLPRLLGRPVPSLRK